MATAAATETRSQTFLILTAFFSFVVMGMTVSTPNVVWDPAMLTTFNLGLADIGGYLLAQTAGYFITSLMGGRLFVRFNPGVLLATACTLSAIGLGLLSIAPAWWMVILCAGFFGLNMGIQDTGLNIIFAARYDARRMNWLHACFGVGATIAPLIATRLIADGAGWRPVYIMIASLYVAAAVFFFVTRDGWHLAPTAQDNKPKQTASLRATLRLPIVWIGIGLFVALVTLEAATGQWASSLLQARGADEVTAGTWVGWYWLSFTIGRILFGILDLKFNLDRQLFGMGVGALAGVALLTWSPLLWLDLVALLLIGFSIAPMFPTMMTRTQTRLGTLHAPNAIGIQVAAAALSIGVMPTIAGVLAENLGLEVVPVYLLSLAVLYIVLMLVVMRIKFSQPAISD
ncbi:MAG: MFS transporter [Chloroflexota bacterium]|nr:MFS transporter [Chloroflexota bacterium]